MRGFHNNTELPSYEYRTGFSHFRPRTIDYALLGGDTSCLRPSGIRCDTIAPAGNGTIDYKTSNPIIIRLCLARLASTSDIHTTRAGRVDNVSINQVVE